MDMACVKHGEYKKRIQIVGFKNLKERDYLEVLGIDGKIILNGS
jgi:hypothetical protein